MLFSPCYARAGTVVVLSFALKLFLMEKIKQSFIAIVEGEPTREHYTNFLLFFLCLSALITIVYFATGMNHMAPQY